MSENVATEFSQDFMGRPVSTLQPTFVPQCMPLGHGWVPAQGKSLALFRQKPLCTQEVLLKDFMVHCMGQSYQWNTAQTEEASLGKYHLFHRLNFERSNHKYLRTRDRSRYGSEIMEGAYAVVSG